MKHYIVLLGLVILLFSAGNAHAQRANLLTNGSFEQGFDGWEMHDQRNIVAGRCGPNAANLPRSFARQVGFKLQAGRTYKLVFWYKGTLNVSVANGEYLKAADWTKAVYTFTAEQQQTTLWFMTFENTGAVLDCVKLVQK
jgi:hypothetical protein